MEKSEKMVRFLNSIGIENIDDFDIDFEMIARNRFKKEQFDMIIVKATPWNYIYLREFQDALINIKYPYLLRFSYLNRPKFSDACSLFDEWYQTIYRFPHTLTLVESQEDVIKITYSSNEEKEQYQNAIKDFKDFLDFISYEFVIKEEVKEVEEVVSIPSRTMKKIVKNALEEASQTLEENDNVRINDRSDIEAQIESERIDMANNVSEDLLKIMRRNAREMAKERERARLNRRGNYEHIALIDSLTSSKNVDFNGFVYSVDSKIFAGSNRVTIGVCDDALGAIKVIMYENQTTFKKDTINSLLKSNVRVRGVTYIDDFTKQLMVKGHYIDLLPPDPIVKEPFETNRVELHLHSNMSTQDGVTKMIDYCSYAKALGHKALAITDHGSVQGFPDAQSAALKTGIKLLYGCEFYMVDNQLEYIKNPINIPLIKGKYVVLDLETTGLSSRYNRIIEFGAVKIEHGIEIGRMDILINPKVPLPKKIVEVTNITDDILKDKPTIKEALPLILEFLGDAILVTHNANFDISFLQEALKNNGFEPLTNPVVDTLALSRYLFPDSRNHRLGTLCRRIEVKYDEESAHRADYDASVLAEVWQTLIVMLTKDNLNFTHADLARLQTPNSLLKHIRPMHIIAFAKNKKGLHDLYKLVSIANIDYLAEVPKIPRTEINKYRENLIISSACFNSDVYDASRYYNKEKLKEVIKFYDYIEVQPPENYSFFVNIGEIDEEDVKRNIIDIIAASEEVGKLVCATGDVHYLTPKEKVFRDIYINAQGVGKTRHPLNPYRRDDMPHFDNPDQHYRTTKEMLDAFSFLGEDKAKEIVITNTNLIADSIESILPVPNDHLYTPTIEHCEEDLSNMCYQRAYEWYSEDGKTLPEFIQKRLETELNGIINNGYSVIYFIAHKIIDKANSDGYLVGSRGSVGSSFVATMAGITEVNPLPPHYRCPKCKHLIWGKDIAPSVRSGFDLPDMKCPNCGEEMIRDGQNIPFETFLGFSADKTPDIDLNFPGDYQARAHDYTKVLLGEDNVFRAGTIETVAEKTAYGFARKYIESLGINPDTYPKAKIDYLASGCVDVKRTTGQHPGGIVVIPREYEVYDFTPVQWPADEVESAWKTTHFDFHSIHDTILKLDLLGHVDPMALKMMSDLTGIDVKTIPMNDPNVLSLFTTNEALNLKRNYLGNKNGALAIPEFGTNFVRGILDDSQPKTFSDLVIISGVSHGTDVWDGNAKELIQNGIATLQEVIGCRDDIMTYLIDKGLPSKVSFSIMEDVRKGRGLKPEYVEIMKANNVPQYYIDSCNKIKYMFPKGHATAYVMMALRVGYFKVYYPLEFYATFFTLRSKQYDIEPMIKGEEAIISRLDELKVKSRTKGEELTNKEEEQLKTLSIAIEMVQRGYSFLNIDLYKSDATKFVVDHERNALIPPFITIDGLGENNAITVVEARKEGKFTSKEDLLRRTKLTSTNVNDLSRLGVLDGLGESDQLSLFDFLD